MIYITTQYLTDKKRTKQENQLNIFSIFLSHLEKLVAMATPMHIL